MKIDGAITGNATAYFATEAAVMQVYGSLQVNTIFVNAAEVTFSKAYVRTGYISINCTDFLLDSTNIDADGVSLGGFGTNLANPCPGASHAGAGGGLTGNPPIYGAYQNPNTSGSSGCAIQAGNATQNGGLGGGNVQIIAFANLHLNGNISVNGVAGSTAGSSGGSGGSVAISAIHFYGNGSITANGGSGIANSPVGAGGGTLVDF